MGLQVDLITGQTCPGLHQGLGTAVTLPEDMATLCHREKGTGWHRAGYSTLGGAEGQGSPTTHRPDETWTFSLPESLWLQNRFISTLQTRMADQRGSASVPVSGRGMQ